MQVVRVAQMRRHDQLREEDAEQRHDGVLQEGREAEEQPVRQEAQLVGRSRILEEEAEERRAKRRPNQAQVQKHGLVAQALVAVVQD